MIKLPLQYRGGKDDFFSKMMLGKLDIREEKKRTLTPPPTSLQIKINSIYFIGLNIEGIGR